MKAHIKQNFLTFFIFKQPLCLKSKLFSGWQSLLSFSEPLYLLVQSLQKSSILRTIAHVFKAQLAGIVALIKSYTANKRILVGLVVMYVGAALAYFSYELFDRQHHYIGWFHHNWWHLFFLLRYQVSQIIFLVGLYIALPKESVKKAIAPYLGFIIMGLILNVAAESNDDVWDTMDLTIWFACAALSIAIFIILDFLTHRRFHQKDSFEAREKGLEQIAYDVDAEKFRSMVLEVWKKKREFKNY
jgi:hypothetical protein